VHRWSDASLATMYSNREYARWIPENVEIGERDPNQAKPRTCHVPLVES